MSIQPLDGVRILDFSTLLPGPLASLMLAEAGAEVLKIKRPGGEDLRHYPPQWEGSSSLYASLNRGKKALELDLRSEEAMETLRPLIKKSHILIEQFRPGVMKRLGLDYETVKTINPGIIYCSITGFGQTGPRADEAGHDVNFTALSGSLSFSTGPDANPTLPPFLVGDIGGGTMPAVINMLLALRQRDQTGEGCHLDISMADNVFAYSAFQMAAGQVTGKYPGNGDWLLTGASPRYQLYQTEDGRLLACAPIEEKFWKAFCDVIKLPDDLRQDWTDPEATLDAIKSLILAHPASYWEPRFSEANCCVSLVKHFDEAMRDPHFIERGLFKYQVENEKGSRITASVMPISDHFRNREALVRSAPVLGKQADFE